MIRFFQEGDEIVKFQKNANEIYRMETIFGLDNIFIGESAGFNTGNTRLSSDNVAIGRNAMGKVVDGADNVAVGKWTLRENVSGKENTAIGNNAMIFSLGKSNTTVGNSSLNTVNDNCIGIGNYSGFRASDITNNRVFYPRKSGRSSCFRISNI